MIRLPIFSCLLVLAVAACGSRDPIDRDATNTRALPEVNAPAPSASGEPHGNTAPAKPLPVPSSGIPSALQGRWGLTPADCTPGRPGARGLLEVMPGELRFHDSSAVPAADVASDPVSIAGNFAFAGDGRSWTKYEALKVDKRILTRTEMNPSASFSYAKCM